jgi:stage V sporulation protein SpoVS
MALTVNTQTQAGGVVNQSVGQVTTDAGAAADTAITLGFVPRYVQWVDRTNRITLEWFEGMAANSAIRTVAAGTRTLDVSAGITVSAPSSGALTFTIKAADIAVSSSFSWRAMA